VRNNPLIYDDPSGNSWLSKSIDKINAWSDKNTWGAFVVQQFSLLAGTALLSRTETGRNIIAGEIIAGTAYASFGIGGAVWAGALSGELVGGYSAYQSGGSILSGVAVGGAVGAGTGYLGAHAGMAARTAMGSTRSGYVIGGAVRGSIVGAGTGGIAGFGGGKGNLESTWRGVYRGAFFGGVLGGGLGYFQYPGGPQMEGGPGNILSRTKDILMKTAQEKSDDPMGSFVRALAKEFVPRLLNTLAERYPDLGYSLVSDVSGVAVMYHSRVRNYLEEQGLSGKTKINF
jgi:hypothetical protein